MVLVSQAIDDLISGIQSLLSAMVGLGVVMLIAALVILGGVLMLSGIWRLVRLLPALASVPEFASGQTLTGREHVLESQ